MDDSDSLFEGMILFNPNSSFEPEDFHRHAGDILETPSSDPLDESLFSDLTIISPPEDEPPRETAAVSRPVSRKKKRASLRIGYGRGSSSSSAAAAEDNDDDEEPQGVPPSASGESASAISDGDRLPEDDRQDNLGDADGDEARLERIRAGVAEKLEAARRLASAASERRKEAIARRRRAADRLRTASDARAELERRLDEACEKEDFEVAERLSEGLAATEGERLSLAAAMREAEVQSDAAEATMEAALASQIAAEEECASLLDGFAKDASNKADSVIRTAQEVFSKHMEKWDFSTEALEVRRTELEIESHVMKDAHAGLNSSIEHLVEDDKKERELLCKRKDVLMDELQKLLLLVRQKEQEIGETDCIIEAVDKRIADVVSGFQDMRSDVESKVGNLECGLSEIELERETLAARKKEIDDVLAREEEKGAKLRELANASAEQAKAYREVVGLRKDLMVSVLKAQEDKARLVKTEEKLSDEVQTLQQVLSTSRASLQELSTRKSSIQQDITSSKQRILFIDKRVPELEAEKKVAAAARNFKEAARIAAEAKSLIVEKDGIQIAVEKGVSDLEKLQGEIKDTVEKLEETEALISSKEKEVAMARYERLLLIVGSATAERAVALELGNQEEADLLLAEAEATDSEAKALQPMYDFKAQEFPNVPKHFVSIELVANLGKKQLEELSALIQK